MLLARCRSWPARRTAGWVVAGLGGFDVYDRVVDHLVLRIHPVLLLGAEVASAEP